LLILSIATFKQRLFVLKEKRDRTVGAILLLSTD
jgi:hypothetical protein